MKQFVERNFYVDDGLKHFPDDKSAISLLKKTHDILNILQPRLHKIASNSKEVMESFPPHRASDLKDLDLSLDILSQHSLCSTV